MECIVFVFVSLLACLAHCQTYPYVSFMGQTLANHSYVNLSLVGSSNRKSVHCVTDLSTCCSGSQGIYRGDWYFPNGNRLPFIYYGDIYYDRGPQRAHLKYNKGKTIQEGIYRCNIPTNAVHHPTVNSLRDKIYLGLYKAERGTITMRNYINITAINITYFTLTCISTGGPATTVTWTRDSTIFTEGTETVLNNAVTASYTHSVTVGANQFGLYTCDVSNNKPSSTVISFLVQGPIIPQKFKAVQDGSSSILLSWILSTNATGYFIYYNNASSETIIPEIFGNNSVNTSLTELVNGETYIFTLFVVTSDHSYNVTEYISLVPEKPGIITESESATNTSITISWTIPHGSVVTRYTVYLSSNVCLEEMLETNYTTTDNSTQYTITDLRPGTTYNISVAALNSAGSSDYSDPITLTTEEEVPTGPPTSVTVVNITSFTITIAWEDVPCTEQNGKINSYFITYTEIRSREDTNGSSMIADDGSGSERCKRRANASTTNKSITLLGLKPSTNYSITLAALNNAGIGTQSSPILVNTEEASFLEALSISEHSIEISWELIEGHTSNYSIFFMNANLDCFNRTSQIQLTHHGKGTRYTLNRLEEGTDYTITVSTTLCSVKEADTILATTATAVPSSPPTDVSIKVKNKTTAEVSWGPVEPCSDRNGEITGYMVMYGQEISDEKNRKVFKKTGNFTGGTITVNTLTHNTKYEVEVAANTTAGKGVFSQPVTFMTPDHVYLTLKGCVIPQHSHLNINDIGSTNNTALLCHTNNPPLPTKRNSGGDWFKPNGSSVGHNDMQGFFRNRDRMLIRLKHGSSSTSPEGIFKCVINDISGVPREVFVGIYKSNGGKLNVTNVSFTLLSKPTSSMTQFNITCVSKSGPATTVTWTRDSIPLTNGTVTILLNTSTAEYIHYLSVTGMNEGLYSCRVENIVSDDNATINVTAPAPPSNVVVSQYGLRSVMVSWKLENYENVNGFVISYYSDLNSTHHDTVELDNDTNITIIDGLIMGATYSISIVSISSTLPSLPSESRTIIIENTTININPTTSSVQAGSTQDISCSVTLPETLSGIMLEFNWSTPDTNSEHIAMKTSSSITINGIQPDQAGMYICSVSFGGTISVTTIISVEVPMPTPVILSTNPILTAGTNTSFRCDYTLSSFSHTKYASWTIDGNPVEVSSDDDNILLSENGLLLMFTPLTTSDSGNYSCSLNISSLNQYVILCGSLKTAELEVTVNIPPPDVAIYLNNTNNFYIGTVVDIVCSVTLDWFVNNNEAVTISWNVENGDRYSINETTQNQNEYTSLLRINPLLQTDKYFECTVNVSGGMTVIESGNISFTPKDLPEPAVIVQGRYEAEAGDEFKLICNVTTVDYLISSATLTVTWSGKSVGTEGVSAELQSISTTKSTSTLLFSSLNVSHGSTYYCHATLNVSSIGITKHSNDSTDLYVRLPSPIVELNVSSGNSVLISGSPLFLICSVQQKLLYTNTAVNYTWITPCLSMNFNSTIEILKTKTADSGMYTCSVTVVDLSGNPYVLDSMTVEDNVTVVVKLNVTITIMDDHNLPTEGFKAGSKLKLKCIAKGANTVISYTWSGKDQPMTPDCSGCRRLVPNYEALLTAGNLHSYHAGNYTCTAGENGKPYTNNSDVFSLKIRGANIIAGTSNETVSSGVVPNNGIVVSTSSVVIVNCISNSSQPAVGKILTPNNTFVLPNGKYGKLNIVNPLNRPGVLRFRTNASVPLPKNLNGIYTCIIPDNNGKNISINVGLYHPTFTKGPNITSVIYDEDNHTLTCFSTDSPPTVVSWMKNGQTLTIDGSNYELTQTIIDRTSSTYSNVLRISNTDGGIAGTYTCSVSNVLGSDAMDQVAIGISIIGLEQDISVGDSATIICTVNEDASVIELRNTTSRLAISNENNIQELSFTIDLVTDRMHREKITCSATVSGTNNTEYAELRVLVPQDHSLYLRAESPDQEMVMAGNSLETSCIVREVVKGLTNMPYANWISAGSESSANSQILQTENVSNETVAIATLKFSVINTSQAGVYICQGRIESPAIESGYFTVNVSYTVTVKLPDLSVTLSIPHGPLYEGTIQSLTCNVTLPSFVDSDTNTSIQWIPMTSRNRTVPTRPSGLRSPFVFTLTLYPLARTDDRNYTCTVTALSLSPYIENSQPQTSMTQHLSITELPPANITISFPEGSQTIVGEDFWINCSAVVVDKLIVKPDISITFKNSTLKSVLNSSLIRHTFSHLKTSDGGLYKCSAAINIPEVGISNVTSSVVKNITVRIPMPNISFSGSLPFTSLYSATVFNLTCRVQLHQQVDTPVTVKTEWRKDGTILANTDSRVFPEKSAMSIGEYHIYESNLRFNLLSIRDNRSYICSATVWDDEYIIGSSSNNALDLVVKKIPPPVVEIKPIISNSTAGSISYLECKMQTVDGVRPGDISVTWLKPNEKTEAAANQTTIGNMTIGRLNFIPLNTSNGGNYTCIGRIRANSVDVDISRVSSPSTVRVEIPAPQVSVSITTGSETVSQGTTLVLLCSSMVHLSVNTKFSVNITWKRKNNEIVAGRFVNVSTISGSGYLWSSSLTISPVNTSDTANYTCISSVYPNDDTFIRPSKTAKDTVVIQVNELKAPQVIGEQVSETAGQYFSTKCNHNVPQDLVTTPIIKWVGPDGMIHSQRSTLSFPKLMTSRGGKYSCIVNITIPQLGISLSENAITTLRVQIPNPMIEFKNDTVPFNGSIFNISCIVTVDSSVDTNVTIKTEWKLPLGLENEQIKQIIDMVGRLNQQRTLTFKPLNANHSRDYECHANVNPNVEEFVIHSTENKTHTISVEKLPLPDVLITVSSTTGLGEDQCLKITEDKVSDASDAVTCEAETIPNLLHLPNITLWRGDSFESSTSLNKSILTGGLNGVQFYCRVCIDVIESGIKQHCSKKSVVTSNTKPPPVRPVPQIHNQTHLTISWIKLTMFAMVRYILDVEEFVADGPGKVRVQSIAGYPIELSVTKIHHTITSLRSEMPYIVTLVAGNGVGCGSKRSHTLFTREGVPKSPPHDVVVEWLPNATAMRVSFTRLSIVEANSIDITYTIRYSSSPITMKRESQIREVLVKERDNETVIGDLVSTLDYYVVVDATNNNGTVSSPPFLLQTDRSQSSGSNAGTAAGIVVFLLLLLLAIAVALGIVILYRRKRNFYGLGLKKKPLLKGTQGLYTIRPIEQSKMMELENRATQGSSQPEPSETVTSFAPQKLEMDPSRLAAIAIEDFEQHCNNHHQSRDAGFETEYETLAVGPLAAHEISQTLYNKQKNRFANIYPYDETRVVLDEIPGDMGSDYINASWIDGYKHSNAYIASQGPKASTVGDFWRMIWQHKINHIVMVTGLCEGGRVKCERYWSEEVGGVLEVEDAGLTATTTSITTHRDFVVRTINVKKDSDTDEKPLSVTQFHFTSWPDHGVPKFATSLVSFIRRVKKSHDKDGGIPLLVHCSAGVGRTGTFILLDSMLDRIKEENTINVYEFLVGMRKRRVLMVQTQAQYAFVHDALCEVIKCGDTEISASRLREMIDSMSQPLSNGDITGFEQQFQLLDKVSRKPVERDFAIAREHPTKNRYDNHLPYSDYMACLKHIENEDSYINASFIDGYKYHKAYIATQGPLQNTVSDIWRMMWEFKSKVMVMLCSFTENGHEACHPFWPNREGDTVKYGKMTVTLQSENSFEDFIIRKLSVAPEKGEEVIVTQFHMTSWPEHDRPSSTPSVLQLLEMVTKAQMNSGTRPITVLCNNGVGRTGTFICLHSQLERLKTEGVVDIFQAIKSARIQRAGLVLNMDQYVYCHEVLADFVNSYDNYANFKEMI